MKVGIDIDGTLTDFEKFVLCHGKKYMWRKYRMPLVNQHGYDLDEMFAIKSQLMQRGYDENTALCKEKKILDGFWNRVYLSYIFGRNFREDAKAAINELRRQNHEIFIITSRRYGTAKTLKGAFVRWTIRLQMKRNGINYDHLIIAENDDEKIKEILREEIEVMIDDKPYVVNSLGDKVRIFCISASYNRGKTIPAVKRVKALGEVMEIL